MQTMRRVFYNTVIRDFHDFLLYGNFSVLMSFHVGKKVCIISEYISK